MTDTPNDVDLALPFYVTGRATPGDRATVEAALQGDGGALASHIECIREEMHETQRVNEALGAPSPHAAAQLFARIDRLSPPARERGRIAARLAAWIGEASPGRIGGLALAAAVAIVVEAGLLGSLWLSRPTATFKTASLQGDRTAGTFALIGFAPTATITQVATLLQQHGAAIVDGPKPGGFYRLRLVDDRMTPEALARALEGLRRETDVVRFVAPAP